MTAHNRIPKARLEALTDGIFAVAMTLLVLDIRLPEGFAPTSAAQLLQGLLDLWPKFFPYAVSFMLLGLRWLALVDVRSRAENLGGPYIRWWLAYLMLISCVPFSTMVVGRHASLAPAIWLYCGNTALIAIAFWRMAVLTPEVDDAAHVQQRQVSMGVLMASTLLCSAWAMVDSRQAIWAFALNLLTPRLIRQVASREPLDP
jgi:uncharacterized membrane protein